MGDMTSSNITTSPKSWKPFEKHIKRFDRHCRDLQEFQRALRDVEQHEEGSVEILNYARHCKNVATIASSWKENQEEINSLILDIPETKRKLTYKYRDTLTELLPELRLVSRDAYNRMGTASFCIHKCVHALKRISLKLDERARWYRSHPDLKCPTL